MEAMEEGNVDEDELEDLDEKLEIDYQLGEDLKERVSYLKEMYRFFRYVLLTAEFYCLPSVRSSQEPLITLPARPLSTMTTWRSSTTTSLTMRTLTMM